jgi:hypothetical protein
MNVLIATILNINDWILNFSTITSVTANSPTLHNLHIRFFEVSSYDILQLLIGISLKIEI